MPKRHQTRGAARSEQLNADTVLRHLEPEEEFEWQTSQALPSEAPAWEPPSRTLTEDIIIPQIVELPLEQMTPSGAVDASFEEEDISDAYFAKMHLVHEIKEQALRENIAGTRRNFVRRVGAVTASELLFAPTVSLSKQDQMEVLGRVVDVELPEERRSLIVEKLQEKEKTYAEAPKHFVRNYLQTQWAPVTVIREPVVAAAPNGDRDETEPGGGAPNNGAPPGPSPPAPNNKGRLLIKLKRLPDQKK